MSTARLDVVTPERLVYSGEIDMLIAPGIDGQLGILPHHVPLMTILKAGEMDIRKGEESISLAISGGFLEVRPDRIIVLADTAERDDEIDIERAEQAKQRAEKALRERPSGIKAAQAEAALQRSLVRLQVGRRRRKR